MNILERGTSRLLQKQPAKAKPRVGFVGVGWIGRQRMDAIANAGTVEIVAIADPVQANALQAKEAVAPGAETVDELEDLFQFDLDGVVLATPSAMHAEQCIAALERGLAVFCQKPLARTASECRRIIEAASEANRLLGVDLSYRHITGMQKIRQHIHDGTLGRIFAADLVFHNAYGPDKRWFYNPKLSGGGCVIDLGIHLVDLALWAMDFPRVDKVSSRLFSKGAPLRDRTRQVEDYGTARLDLSNDATVKLAVSWNLSAGCDARIEAGFYGTEGGAILRNVDGSFYDFETILCKGRNSEIVAKPPDAWGGRAAVAWSRQLAEGSGFDGSIERIVPVAEALDSIYES
jgi:predicted dehydrogenase